MRIPAAQWIAWLGATVAAAMTLSAFAFTHFQSKEDAGRAILGVDARLERIERKVDELNSHLIRRHR